MATPIQCYNDDLKAKNFQVDDAQIKAVEYTQKLYEDLLQALGRQQNWLSGLWRHLVQRKNTRSPIKGLYFWGGVGRGKTYLIDNFYRTLPFPEKKRIHFHRFIQEIHEELKTLKYAQNPLRLVAARLAKRVKVLCLDEFHVLDITDAMLLTGLLPALFEQGITLVTTSNLPPEALYKDGLQRERFLPVIALLKQHTHIVNVDNGIDYRLQALEKAEIYHYPLNDAAQQKMLTSFTRLAPNPPETQTCLEVNDRLIPVQRKADGVVWFDFNVICEIPRSVADYIELSKCFNTVFISGVHSMGEAENDKMLRFINLIDEFYDRNVKLVVSAEQPPELLYTGKRQAFQFQRILSRLQEMQSYIYLQRPHLA